MNDKSLEPDYHLIEQLSNAAGVSGAENAVRSLIQEEIGPFVDQAQVDPLGNLLLEKRPSGEAPGIRVLVAAHMDEVGLMLTSKDDEGIYRFAKVGGIPDRFLAGKALWVGQEKISGVIGISPIHFMKGKKKKKIVSAEKLRIDVGSDSSDRVRVGDRAVFATRFKHVGNNMIGKAFDDRLGVALLIALIKHPPQNVHLLGAFTVQEEIGLRGARVAAHALHPDCSIVLDTTPSRDFPSWDEEKENMTYNTRLSKGAAIYVADSGMISDPRLVRHFIQTAEQEDIPFQIRQPGGGRTDAAAIHKQRAGIPSISISVPTRYLHSPASLVKDEDYLATLTLLHKGLETLPQVFPRGSL